MPTLWADTTTAVQRVSVYSVAGRDRSILHEHTREKGAAEGYDVYVPIVDSNRVDETLEALEAYARGDR